MLAHERSEVGFPQATHRSAHRVEDLNAEKLGDVVCSLYGFALRAFGAVVVSNRHVHVAYAASAKSEREARVDVSKDAHEIARSRGALVVAVAVLVVAAHERKDNG